MIASGKRMLCVPLSAFVYGGLLWLTSSSVHAALATNVTAVTAGTTHTCAVVKGGVQCSGDNTFGQLGNNTTTRSDVPVQTIPAGSLATAVSTGSYHSCAVVGTGVQCWGANTSGQLGNGTFTQSLVPVQAIAPSIVIAVAAGGLHTCALYYATLTPTVTTKMKCWGDNYYGQLGLDDRVVSPHPSPGIVYEAPQPAGSPRMSDFTTGISAGDNHTCAIVNGGVQCWGASYIGQRGHSPNSSFYDRPEYVSPYFPGAGVTDVSAGDAHSCAVATGGVSCWGANYFGQLGNNSTTTSVSPVQAIPIGSNATSVSAGTNHTCAVVNGGAQCWGAADNGQLGIAEAAPGVLPRTTQSLVPVQAIAANSRVEAISAGGFHTCALIAVVSLEMTCWGYDNDGQQGGGIKGTLYTPRATWYARGVPIDLNGDGKHDILWQNIDGSTAAWLMNGLGLLDPTSAAYLMGPGTGWRVTHVADFDRNHSTDLVWKHTDGSTVIWLMSGLQMVGSSYLMGPGTGWSVKHIGDFNGDRKSDILWQHTDGRTLIWLMDGLTVTGTGILSGPGGPGSGWTVSKIGDFDGDRKADLIWQQTDGSLVIWLMDGLAQKSSSDLLFPARSGWTAAFVDDFTGDAKDDIVWQNADGNTLLWVMNGLTPSGTASLLGPGGPGSGWSVKFVADFDANGRADLIWQRADGSTILWLMSGLTSTGNAYLIGPNSGWSVKKTGDYNGDGKNDIFWQHTDGSTGLWILTDLAIFQSGGLLGPGSGWIPIP